MTVTYTSRVFTSSRSWTPQFIFIRLLSHLKGSIYKLIWHDILIYFSLYYTLSFTYRFALDEAGARKIGRVAKKSF